MRTNRRLMGRDPDDFDQVTDRAGHDLAEVEAAGLLPTWDDTRAFINARSSPDTA
jgi:hypothetical protein